MPLSILSQAVSGRSSRASSSIRSLAGLVHDDLEAEARAPGQLVGFEHALEQEDGLRGARPRAGRGLLDAGHAQHVGRRQGGQDLGGAVAVGVRLDHSHDLAADGTTRASVRFGGAQQDRSPRWLRA